MRGMSFRAVSIRNSCCTEFLQNMSLYVYILLWWIWSSLCFTCRVTSVSHIRLGSQWANSWPAVQEHVWNGKPVRVCVCVYNYIPLASDAFHFRLRNIWIVDCMISLLFLAPETIIIASWRFPIKIAVACLDFSRHCIPVWVNVHLCTDFVQLICQFFSSWIPVLRNELGLEDDLPALRGR